MNFITKQMGATFAVSALMVVGVMNAQNVQQGLDYLNNDQFDKAKGVFENLVSQSPTADNYYYLGYYYLKSETPNADLAAQNFNKGLAADPKSGLNKVGLAAVKLLQGNKSLANTEFEAAATGTKYKNADVLYQIANAYILFTSKPENMDPDKSIEYSQKLLELVKNKDKADYYITLGNAYYEKLDPGKAMNNYSKALEIADNNTTKARIHALMANIWGRSNNDNPANENFKKAIAADPNYTQTYKIMADYNIRKMDYSQASVNLQKYMELTGNNSSESQFYLAQISYFAKDYDKTLDILNKSWDSISNPLKYKIKALALMEKSDFTGAYSNMNQYLQNIPEAKKEGSDYGVLGKIQSSLASTATGEDKIKWTQEAVANLSQAQAKGDKAYDYQALLSALMPTSPTGGTTSAVTNPKIEALKKAVTSDPNDTKSWYDLATEQYTAKDYLGSVASWDKLIQLIPTWETAYAGKGLALYAYDTNDASGSAAQSYQKYIDMVAPKSQYSDTEKAYLEIAYTFFAYKYFHAKDTEKTQEYIKKTLAIDPQNADIQNLQKLMMK